MSVSNDHKELFQERQELVSAFLDKFSADGYIRTDAEPLIPRTDKSVYFVSATINRFKEDMGRGYAPEVGQILHQKCLRLFSINSILEGGQKPHFCYFTMLGAYRSSDRLPEVCNDLKEFLTNKLGLPSDKIRSFASVHDKEFYDGIADPLNVQFHDGQDSSHEWKFGLEGVRGRGLLVEILSDKGEWREIGQIIHLYKDGQSFGCELAFGVERFQWAKRGYDDFRQLWTIQGIAESQNANQDWRYLDTVSTVATMYHAGVSADNSKHGQLLKKGLRNLSYICRENNIASGEVEAIAREFSAIELGDTSFLEKFMSDFDVSNQSVSHNLGRFSSYVEDLAKKVGSNEMSLSSAFDRAVKRADGACFVPRYVRDDILAKSGLILANEQHHA